MRFIRDNGTGRQVSVYLGFLINLLDRPKSRPFSKQEENLPKENNRRTLPAWFAYRIMHICSEPIFYSKHAIRTPCKEKNFGVSKIHLLKSSIEYRKITAKNVLIIEFSELIYTYQLINLGRLIILFLFYGRGPSDIQ